MEIARDGSPGIEFDNGGQTNKKNEYKTRIIIIFTQYANLRYILLKEILPVNFFLIDKISNLTL